MLEQAPKGLLKLNNYASPYRHRPASRRRESRGPRPHSRTRSSPVSASASSTPCRQGEHAGLGVVTVQCREAAAGMERWCSIPGSGEARPLSPHVAALMSVCTHSLFILHSKGRCLWCVPKQENVIYLVVRDGQLEAVLTGVAAAGADAWQQLITQLIVLRLRACVSWRRAGLMPASGRGLRRHAPSRGTARSPGAGEPAGHTLARNSLQPTSPSSSLHFHRLCFAAYPVRVSQQGTPLMSRRRKLEK